MPFDDLRSFVAFLEDRGHLLRVKTAVDPNFEIAAYIRKTSDQGGPALLFENVKGFDLPVLGGLFATRQRAMLALEVTHGGTALEEFLRRLDHPIPPRLVASGPCKEVVMMGEDVDLARFPVPTYHPKDAGPFITLGVQISKDPDTGARNAGLYRMQVHDGKHLGLMSAPFQHVTAQYKLAESRNEPLEIAVALGVDPAIVLASQIPAPYSVDEIALAGGLRGAPVEVVKCETVDLEVPATSEIVIEGRMLPHQRRTEGPFGEFTGYYTGTGPFPVVEITAITHRRQPIFLAGLTGMPFTENHVLKELPLAAGLFRSLKGTFPSIKDVCFLPGGASHYIAAISVRQQYAGQARHVLLAAMGSKIPPKITIVCDDDVDIADQTQVLWAVSTRSQPDRDVIIVSGIGGQSLDPSSKSRPGLVTSLMGIDATVPLDESFPETVSVSGLDQIPELGRRTSSVVATPAARTD